MNSFTGQTVTSGPLISGGTLTVPNLGAITFETIAQSGTVNDVNLPENLLSGTYRLVVTDTKGKLLAQNSVVIL